MKSDTAAGVVEAAKASIIKARRLAEFEARYARERAEVEAAEVATRDDATSVTDAAYRDAGDATSGTLPLAILGPGGDFTTEVKP